MSNNSRFLLVPQDMYEGLLSSSVPKENPNLIFARDKVNKTRTEKEKDKSVKNVLYNQELRRYLQIRNEAQNKPVKVELSDGRKLIGRSGSPTNMVVGSDGEEDEVASSNLSTHSIPENESDDVETKIKNIVEMNRGLFGVSEEGKIKGHSPKMMPIAKSDFEKSIQAILSPGSIKKEPPGTSTLRKRLKINPRTQELINNVLKGTGGLTSIVEKPEIRHPPTLRKRILVTQSSKQKYVPEAWGGKPVR